jgi:hypothetical protein
MDHYKECINERVELILDQLDDAEKKLLKKLDDIEEDKEE